jgi:predicted alpha/beta-fold hydrolase
MLGKWEVESLSADESPLVIIIPGTNGTSYENYLTSACKSFWDSPNKIRTVVINRRGYSGVPVSCKYAMSWNRWEDIEEVVYWLRTLRKEREIFMYGTSQGAGYTQFHSGRIAELENGAELRSSV